MTIVADNDIPWLQPVGRDAIWTDWQVIYRDVIIIGPGNEYLATFNLSEFDLSNTESYEALKQLLIEAATQFD